MFPFLSVSSSIYIHVSEEQIYVGIKYLLCPMKDDNLTRTDYHFLSFLPPSIPSSIFFSLSPSATFSNIHIDTHDTSFCSLNITVSQYAYNKTADILYTAGLCTV